MTRVGAVLDNDGPFDIINIHGPSPSISDLALLRFTKWNRGAKVVYTHHFALHFGKWFADLAGRMYELFFRRVARGCDEIVTTTKEYAIPFERVGMDVSVIPWGFDQDRFSPGERHYSGDDALRILAVGQFRRYKGMAVAVRAVVGQPELELTLVGQGPVLSSVLQQIPSSSTNVRHSGRVSDGDLGQVMREHDVILLPSRTRAEAFGIVLLEGMASGCLPVASSLPGVREVVGSVGLTTKPGDEESVRNALLSLARDPEEVARLRKAAVVWAESFTWDRTVDAYETLFQRLRQ
jgi:glycosyltransferase involved in cell wall biosynthesis